MNDTILPDQKIKRTVTGKIVHKCELYVSVVIKSYAILKSVWFGSISF
jgi:hypothetical protein